VRATPDFRAGVIYSSQNRRDRLFTTVDIAVVSKDSEEPRVLLGRKSSHAGWRFPGGFVEISDKNLETAAIRELREETDIETTSLTYMGSYQIPDWRVSEGDAIMTVFFLADKVYGNTGKAGDDLSEIKWFSVSELKEMESSWHPDHIELFKDLITEINEW
jgi:ADP-ribose pyrophosphatase YjhB (NUDIX family)